MTLKEGIDALLDSYKLRGKFNDTQLVDLWPKVMGDPIAKRTVNIYAKAGVLYVKLDSGPLKHELSISKSKIQALYAERMGQNALVDIIFR